MPGDFLWGVATSAFQTEGAVREDGRGVSIWDRFPIAGGDTGDVACDFYHRYGADIALARELGIDVFRFSIAWPRVLPEGRGRANPAGLDFYDRLVDALLAAGIQPFATLFHWDLPLALEDGGGWPVRSTAEAFARYAEIVARRLGDRVHFWTTHNEPYCSAWMGYATGEHAPGRAHPAAGAAAAHHILLSHGLAVETIRQWSPGAEVGIVIDSWPQHPASTSPEDVAAARVADGFRNRLFFEPVLLGRYPDDVLERLGPAGPPVCPGDLAVISRKLDFVGINNYSRNVVRAGPDGQPLTLPARGPRTAMGWEIHPDGLYEVLTRLRREYHAPPLIVTESGAAFDDVPGPDGSVDDRDRIAYLEAYLGAIRRAQASGVQVRGHLVWSLLDNFEWTQGYAKRFGLVRVDYATQRRTPKASFAWYRDTIARSRRAAAA
jgi:beta-glucosidase